MTTEEAFKESQSPPPRQSRPHYWSELIRQEPRANPFPVMGFLIGLVPGLVLTILLAIPFLLLWLESNRNIAYLTSNGDLQITQANPVSLQVIHTPPQTTAAVARARLRSIEPLPGLPTMGLPQWSARGIYLVANNYQEDGTIRPTIYNNSFQVIVQLKSPYEISAVPANGWSEEGNVIALVEFDGVRPLLSLSEAPFNRPVIFDFTLDPRAGMDWNPQESNLLLTGTTDNTLHPSLLLVNTSSTDPQVFSPGDGLAWHADGAWSPDGSQIAYIAGNTYTTTQNILAGQLWVVSSRGGGARQLGPHEQVIAPVWSPDGDTIYYTRFAAPSGRFALYRIDAGGTAPPQYIGPSSEDVLRYAWDRSLLFQWSPDNQQLLFIGQEPIPPDYYTSQEPALITLGLQETTLPVVGAASRSHDNQKFGGTILTAEGVQVVVYLAPEEPPTVTPISSDDIVLPTDGWSSNSNIVAMLRSDGTDARLVTLNLNAPEPRLVTSQLLLDLRAGMSWHPVFEQLMVTTLEEGITPTLRIYNPANDTSQIFSPQDGQIVRADGTWSPDGNQVVYVAHETLTPTLEMPFLAGPLWLASSSGQNPVLLVPDGLNFAPIWDPTESRILFTRFLTETERFVLYQVALNENSIEPIGPSSEVFALYPFDRQYFRRWSPEGVLWSLPGANNTIPFIYYNVNDSASSVLDSGCQTSEPYAVRWAPTNRGFLVACPTGEMYLRWTDRDRNDKPYPEGLFPIWQP